MYSSSDMYVQWFWISPQNNIIMTEAIAEPNFRWWYFTQDVSGCGL